MVKVALLSHRGGNIGHDFMAIGMGVVMRAAFGDDVVIEHFEQHDHFSVYPEGHWLRRVDKIRHGRLGVLRRYLNRESSRQRFWPQTRALDHHLAVACGGPNIVPPANQSPELGLMLHHLNGAFTYRGVPLIDAGVGASFPLERIEAMQALLRDSNFYRTAFKLCKAVTVRDEAAHKVVTDLGFETQIIPCGAIATGREFEKETPLIDNKYVIINFQRYGANTDWGQGVDPDAWAKTMKATIAELEKHHPVVMLAHNAYEGKLAQQLAPHLPCHSPTTSQEYARVIKGAKVGIVSRIHAAIPLAGVGVPSVVIGTDTRLGTVEQMGLITRYVKEVNSSWLVEQVESLLGRSSEERTRLLALREHTIARYATLFQSYVKH